MKKTYLVEVTNGKKTENLQVRANDPADAKAQAMQGFRRKHGDLKADQIFNAKLVDQE